MRMMALVRSEKHVCCRYRIAAYEPFIHGAGHSIEMRPWPTTFWSRLRLVHTMPRVDVLFMQRRMPKMWEISWLRRKANHLIFDFDDAVFIRDSYSERGAYCRQRERRFQQAVRNVDLVIAGNEFLASHARRWTSKTRIVTIPTCVDLSRYSPAQHQASTPADAQLVWIGSSSTIRSLIDNREILEWVGRENPGLTLKVICDVFPTIDALRIVPVRWTEQHEAAELAMADIGISWLPDDLWSQGKCGLKILQYMAAGLPVVANPVGVQKRLVRHGENGFLVNSQQEMAQAVRRLIASPSLRRQMGEAGRQRIAREFDVPVGARRLLGCLDELCRNVACRHNEFSNRVPLDAAV